MYVSTHVVYLYFFTHLPNHTTKPTQTHPQPHHHRGQIPLIYITDHLEKTLFKETQAGNFAFWLIFCVLGQPMAVRGYLLAFT